MLISGLILTLEPGDAAVCGIETAALHRPAIVIGKTEGIYLPVATEAEGPERAEDIQNWLESLPGVLHVDVVSVQFTEEAFTGPRGCGTRPSSGAFGSGGKTVLKHRVHGPMTLPQPNRVTDRETLP